METNIIKISDKLYLIGLFPLISGFEDFIGAWLYKGEKNILIDVGPQVTAESLLESLKNMGVTKIDYILLTHIHIDHAGGIGIISENFPNASIILHSSGIPHIADPVRIQEGTIKTLGNIGKSYGPFTPVQADRLVDASKINNNYFKTIFTPGHAPHHISYMIDEYLFAGEASGVYINIHNNEFYLRPATPTKFMLETSIKSIDNLIAENPKTICFGHFGINESAIKMLKKYREQLLNWHKIISKEVKRSENKDLIHICLEKLLHEDIFLKNFINLENAKKNRERIFLQNSIKGFLDFIINR
ncbi:MAG: MBL fold metallo-hydrolase [Desulfobacterales bacterium]|nr:MBL fold metallo-hydrolase [Desulfobacterales bacterium]